MAKDCPQHGALGPQVSRGSRLLTATKLNSDLRWITRVRRKSQVINQSSTRAGGIGENCRLARPRENSPRVVPPGYFPAMPAVRVSARRRQGTSGGNAPGTPYHAPLRGVISSGLTSWVRARQSPARCGNSLLKNAHPGQHRPCCASTAGNGPCAAAQLQLSPV